MPSYPCRPSDFIHLALNSAMRTPRINFRAKLTELICAVKAQSAANSDLGIGNTPVIRRLEQMLFYTPESRRTDPDPVAAGAIQPSYLDKRVPAGDRSFEPQPEPASLHSCDFEHGFPPDQEEFLFFVKLMTNLERFDGPALVDLYRADTGPLGSVLDREVASFFERFIDAAAYDDDAGGAALVDSIPVKHTPVDPAVMYKYQLYRYTATGATDGSQLGAANLLHVLRDWKSPVRRMVTRSMFLWVHAVASSSWRPAGEVGW
ncbi:hypothetical protein C8R46DRAFT_1207752 [Mycena filopes]|nr:hypothetical protein C8R46DRAFT_1207752 [Mycena filopes]